MSKQYLSDDKIKAIRNIINKEIPTKTRTMLLSLKNKYGIELYYGNAKENREKVWNFFINELQKNPEFKAKWNGCNEDPIKRGIIVNEYIDRYFSSEWEQLKNFDLQRVFCWYGSIGSICRENFITEMNQQEIIESRNIDDYLSQFEKKNVDKDSLKATDDLCNILDSLFKDANDQKIQNIKGAINLYLTTRDKNMLHNYLNQTL